MTREEIIGMARGQGLPETSTEGVFIVNTDDLGRMLAAEREACARTASIALLGADKSLIDRVLNAIRSRGQRE